MKSATGNNGLFTATSCDITNNSAGNFIMLIVDDKQRGNLDYLALYESKNLDVSYYLCSKIYSI